MKKMTRQQTIQFIMDLKGAKPATIVTETRPKMNKFARTPDVNGNRVSNPFLDKVVKRTRMNVFLNFNYENSVNNQRDREQKEKTFESQQRSWGEHVSPSLIVHRGEHYLQYKLQKRYEAEYIDTDTGERITLDQLTDYMPPRSASRTQGVDKQIIVLTTKVNNLIELNTAGEKIQVERF